MLSIEFELIHAVSEKKILGEKKGSHQTKLKNSELKVDTSKALLSVQNFYSFSYLFILMVSKEVK